MTPFIEALSNTARSIRHEASRIGRRFTRKAEIKFGITVRGRNGVEHRPAVAEPPARRRLSRS